MRAFALARTPTLSHLRVRTTEGHDIEGRYRAGEPFEIQRPNRLAFDQILDCSLNACAEEDLASFGLVRETRGKICDRPDRGVLEQSLRPDAAESRVARERLRCRS